MVQLIIDIIPIQPKLF